MDDGLQAMLETIRTEAMMTRRYTGRDHFSDSVMGAMAEVDRARFVPDHEHKLAYADGPLPIGFGQTISQPYMVALMTDLLDLRPAHRVLEIGTGSGYQSAVLARLAKQVYTLEKIPELAQSAHTRLRKLGYDNVETRCSNGYHGWQEKSPFDAIIVTAAASHIPDTLVKQLKPGGRMVIPVGQPLAQQELILLEKDQTGTTHRRRILAVAFVPLVMDET